MGTNLGKTFATRKASQVNLAGLIKNNADRILLVTAAGSGAGVTTSVLTLARELRQSTGEPVVLVDMGHGDNSLTSLFGLQENKGLRNAQEDVQILQDCLVHLDEPDLSLLPAGQGADISRKDLGQVLEHLARQFRFVILDAAPVYAGNSTVENCPLADALILVIRAEETRWEVVSAARQRLSQAGANIVGCIFNDRKYYTPGWLYNKL